MLIEPSDGGDIYDPEFIDESYRFVSSLTGFSKVRELVTVLDTVALISRESYKKGLATERQELKDIFFLIESDLNPRVKEQFWFQKGIRVSITTATNYSKEMQTLSEAILEKSAQFKGLKASFFGTTALYPRFDEYVRDGKPWNVMSSQWLIVVVCAIWIFFRSYGNRNNTPYVMYGVRSGLVMSVPFVFATSLMALVMMAFNIPLDIATATISALAINASIDFSIYFMAEYSHLVLVGKNRQEALSDSLSNEGRLVVEDSLLNITCFLPLLLSSFPPVAKIGWIMGVMLVACCIGTILLMPALLPICVGERRPRRESELRRFAARALPVYQRDRGEM